MHRHPEGGSEKVAFVKRALPGTDGNQSSNLRACLYECVFLQHMHNALKKKKTMLL